MSNLLDSDHKTDNNIGSEETLWDLLGENMDSLEYRCTATILAFKLIAIIWVQQDDSIRLKYIYQLILLRIFLILCPILLLSSLIV